MNCHIIQTHTRAHKSNTKQCSRTWNPLIAVMTTELGVCLNKALLLSRPLLACSKHRDLPPPLIPPLSPATNQVCQTTFSLSLENGRLLSENKETEDEQSLKKRLTLSERSHRAGTFLFPSSLRLLGQCQRLVFGIWARRCLWSAGDWAAGYWYIVQVNGNWDKYYQLVSAATHWFWTLQSHKKKFTLSSICLRRVH